jgi:cytoskeletal protein RodZ
VDPNVPSPAGGRTEPPIPELLRLGEQLAQARQSAGMSEDDLAQRLRLAPGQLKALEAGDHTRLPEGVFVVALARRIGGALNVDLEDAIQAVRQSRLMRRVGPTASPLEASPRVSPPATSTPPASAPLASAQPASAPLASGPGDNRSSRRRPLLVALIAAGILASAWLLVSRPGPRGIPTLSASPGSPARPPAPAAPGAPAAPAERESLRLSASEPSWVQVREVTGRTLFEGTLTGERRFPIGQGIEVISGRPHAVRAAIGAGVSAPLGGVSDIRWKRFSPADSPPAPPSSPSPSP